MLRWLLILICTLALVASSSAQNDDLDALLAGLGDEPVATEDAAAGEIPAVAEGPVAEVAPAAEAPAAAAAVEDPFADLLGADAAAPAAEPIAEEVPAESPAAGAEIAEIPAEAPAAVTTQPH